MPLTEPAERLPRFWYVNLKEIMKSLKSKIYLQGKRWRDRKRLLLQRDISNSPSLLEKMGASEGVASQCAHARFIFRKKVPVKMAANRQHVNPEYYDCVGPFSGPGSIDKDDPATKKRKLMNMSVCVDHLRGFCSKGARCPKVHSDHVPSIDEREIMAKAKFCHDYQNRGVCSRMTCRFLHVTRREEDEFLLTGVIPMAVFKRAQEGGGGGAMYGVTPPSLRFRDESSLRGGVYHPPLPPLPPMTSPYDRFGYMGGAYGTTHWAENFGSMATTTAAVQRGGAKVDPALSSSQPITYGNYCIDFLKGSCSKGSNCRLVHVGVVEDMDDREAIVKNVFCHDFQNKRCPRVYCKYIHANFDEQKVFIEEGYFTDALCSRNRGKMFFCDVCIDYLRSQCTRGTSCQFRHVKYVEEKEERICLSRSIFCHDYQEGTCPRVACKLLHTSKEDENYFLQTGSLPDTLSSVNTKPAEPDTVCRDYLKGLCNRGTSCKYYHPSDGQGVKSEGGGDDKMVSLEEHEKVKKENEELKQRIQQLERLLADACHCITLAVGDQNPAVKTLMESIVGMAPQSALAKQETPTTTSATTSAV